VFVVSHHKLEALLLYFDSRLSRCVRIRIARRIGRCWQRSHPLLLVMHTSALRQQLTGGSSAHLSMKPSPAQPYYLLGPTWQLAMAHGGSRGTAPQQKLPSLCTLGRPMDARGAASADAATNPSPAPAVVVDHGGISKLAYLAPFCCILSLSCVLSWPIRSISWIIFTSLVPLAYV
jgi:hypothetical protein